MMKTFGRFYWIDSLRGAAILLVIHLHVVNRVYQVIADANKFLENFTTLIAPLRMPLLLFLSGLFVSHSISKGSIRFFKGKVNNILYPYTVWTIITFSQMYFVNELTGEVFNKSLLEAFLFPIAHMWFLYNLLIYFIIIYFLNKVTYVLPLVLSLLSYIVLVSNDITNFQLNKFVSLFFFFSLGSYLGQNISKLTKIILNIDIKVLIILGIIGIFSTVENLLLYNGGSYTLCYSISCLLLIPAILRLSTFLGEIKPLRYVGENSLVIYLVHLPIANVLLYFFKSGFTNNYVILYIIMMILTILISLLILKISNKNKIFSIFFRLASKNK
ncbi:acyltransferase family protein [Psychrobacter sp. VH5]|uniref:acyltransferase family protein n=1 Tax=Psychrobacter sp. VH5 TaxID=3423439 RepID=UPI003D647F0C